MLLHILVIITLFLMGWRIMYLDKPQKNFIKTLTLIAVISIALANVKKITHVVHKVRTHQQIDRQLGAFFISLSVGMSVYLWILG